MRRLNKWMGTILLLAVMSFGSMQAFAEGPTETPGIIAPTSASETEVSSVNGPTETPGYAALMVYLMTTLIP